jgi:hypothetical protein
MSPFLSLFFGTSLYPSQGGHFQKEHSCEDKKFFNDKTLEIKQVNVAVDQQNER